ncbi:MAG: mandelate racemase/muconate lactonizing enzyme family protein [Acidimicrobiaceae bacterium]|nr:mandelate racemase/muconate lactonizing enzyme family protein [Acidimicrobiaceae bacterium]
MSVIQRIDVFSHELNYAHGDYVMSGGRTIRSLLSTVVRVTTESGVEGFGEVCPLGPNYLPGYAHGAPSVIREFARALIGLDVENLGLINQTMDAALSGHGYAKSPVDIACWDAFGKLVGQPVYTLLGGRRNDDLPLYVAIPLDSTEEMVKHVVARKAEGTRRFQLKVGADPHDDATRVTAIVDATDANDFVVADANCGWRLQDAVIAARLLNDLDRVFLEQPCRTLEECLIVRERTSLPMILDEVIVDPQALLRAYDAKAMEAINLKVSRVGGLSKARFMRDLCEALGVRMTIEDTWGGDMTTAAVSHLAASTDSDLLFAASYMNDWVLEHTAGYSPRSHNGRGSISGVDAPGLGIDVDVTSLGQPLFSVDARDQ